jgi:hypothetical protein
MAVTESERAAEQAQVLRTPDVLAMVRPENDALRRIVKTGEYVKQALRSID